MWPFNIQHLFQATRICQVTLVFSPWAMLSLWKYFLEFGFQYVTQCSNSGWTSTKHSYICHFVLKRISTELSTFVLSTPGTSAKLIEEGLECMIHKITVCEEKFHTEIQLSVLASKYLFRCIKYLLVAQTKAILIMFCFHFLIHFHVFPYL